MMVKQTEEEAERLLMLVNEKHRIDKQEKEIRLLAERESTAMHQERLNQEAAAYKASVDLAVQKQRLKDEAEVERIMGDTYTLCQRMWCSRGSSTGRACESSKCPLICTQCRFMNFNAAWNNRWKIL